ncbi:MAG TPA: response regulator [Candidatus Aminicenantes bacterium]|nr:response regulator [Candidatus Aminicenantes bacterium]
MAEKMTVLLVEDEKATRKTLRFLLARLGYRVLEAENGRRALELLEVESPVDLVITDRQMPEMDGDELVRVLSSGKTLLMMISGSFSEEDKRSDLVVSGRVRLVEKPFLPQEFLTAVRSLLARGSSKGREAVCVAS